MRNSILFLLCCLMAIGFLTSLEKRKPLDEETLGRMLFFDPMLSRNRTVSCASCHRPEFAFADTSVVSTGVYGRKGTRNSPSAMNVALQKIFFWDGRAATLEEQALAPIENPDEMDLPLETALLRLQRSQRYRNAFMEVFHEAPNRENLAIAIASFERSLETGDSPFDKWKMNDDTGAVSAAVKRGFAVFNKKGKCSSCHFGSNFTQNEFRNIGLFDGKMYNDSGRISISGKQEDMGKFKTPQLRNIALTAPYMHNGIFKTLREVIDFYDDPSKKVPGAINRDTLLQKPLQLTDAEKSDLEAFLLSLTDARFQKKSKGKR